MKDQSSTPYKWWCYVDYTIYLRTILAIQSIGNIWSEKSKICRVGRVDLICWHMLEPDCLSLSANIQKYDHSFPLVMHYFTT